MQQFEYYLDNRDHILQKKKEYREKNKEDIAKKKHEWDLKNKDKKMINDKKYREKKKQKLIESGKYIPQREKTIFVLKECLYCSKSFVTTQKRLDDNRGKFCSKKCQYQSWKRIGTKICEVCGGTIIGRPSEIQKRKFCSKKCSDLFIIHTKRIHKSNLITKECLICKKYFKTKFSRIKDGKGKLCRRECADLYRTKCAIDDFFKRVNYDFKQIKGKTNLDINWSSHIKTRDKICQICGKKTKDAHHILHRQFYPLLRFNENNGIGLCELCHCQSHGLKLLFPVTFILTQNNFIFNNKGILVS